VVLGGDGGPGGRPHVRPVLAVWVHDKVYSTTSPGARKGRNLQAGPECSIVARAPAIDIVIEGATSWVDDPNLLEQIAAAYHSKYEWPVTITGENMFTAPTAHRPQAPALPGLRDHP
jgi:Pyridoxamine 5'-phosphate oxidase